MFLLTALYRKVSNPHSSHLVRSPVAKAMLDEERAHRIHIFIVVNSKRFEKFQLQTPTSTSPSHQGFKTLSFSPSIQQVLDFGSIETHVRFRPCHHYP